MDIDSLDFSQKIVNLKQGQRLEFYYIVENTLYLIDEELNNYNEITEPMANICLLALINGIKIYDFKTPLSTYLKNYIHDCLISMLETKLFISKLDFDLPIPILKIRVPKEKLQNYVTIITQNHETFLKNNSQDNKSLIKML